MKLGEVKGQEKKSRHKVNWCHKTVTIAFFWKPGSSL